MKKLLNLGSALVASLKPRANGLTIESYGQKSCGISPEQIQGIMEWLSASLVNAGYMGQAHIIWDKGGEDWEKEQLTAMMRGEPMFLYRCAERPSEAADGCYWRLMGEHSSLRVYQLEVDENS